MKNISFFSFSAWFITIHIKTSFSPEPFEPFDQFQEQELGQSISYCGYGYGPPQMDTSRPNSDLDGYSDIWEPCCRWSSPEKGRNFTDSGSITPEFMFSTLIQACEERCTQTWTRVYLNWNCTRCTLQTSSPEPSLGGEEEVVCQVHKYSFSPNVNEEVAKYPNAKLARRGVLGLPLSWHWDEPVEVLHLFWSTSYEYTNIMATPDMITYFL